MTESRPSYEAALRRRLIAIREQADLIVERNNGWPEAATKAATGDIIDLLRAIKLVVEKRDALRNIAERCPDLAKRNNARHCYMITSYG